MNIYQILGKNIKALRIQKNISQEKLALLSYINTTYASKIERGIANPSIKILRKISLVLKTPIHEFFD